ncbi:MAG: HAMP domain-containing sensor histidine kinase, partial [Gemmatimonadaceae bacterium]
DVVAEYRALRASVLRRQALASDVHDAASTANLIRFNEAIDQALSESVAIYARNVEYSRDMFIAVLGHDLRSPLSAVLMACQLMLSSQNLDESTAAHAERINRSAKRMSEMVSQLLDFTRARLGNGLPMTPGDVDVAELAVDAVDEIRTAHPRRDVQYHGVKNLRARGDDVRIRQVLSNLLGNAVQHGASDAGITVRLSEADNVVEIRVHNSGAVMSALTMSTMFSPFKRLTPGTPIDAKSTSLGLGLYIAQQIVLAHAGTISATSDGDDGTEFLVRLPRGK